MHEVTDERLATLRVSVARLAQICGVDNELSITGDSFPVLTAKAFTRETGWNDLCGRIADKLAAEYAQNETPPEDADAYLEGE